MNKSNLVVCFVMSLVVVGCARENSRVEYPRSVERAF